MEDDTLDTAERHPSGRIKIDDIYSGEAEEVDERDQDFEEGIPVSNADALTFMTNVVRQRQATRPGEPRVPIPETLVTAMKQSKLALQVTPISYIGNTKEPIGPRQFTDRWSSRVPQRVGIGREITRQLADRKGNSYERKFYVGEIPNPDRGGDPKEGEIIELSHDMEPFEVAQFINLAPESAEEARALIPTLNRLMDKEIHYYRDELTRFNQAKMPPETNDPGAKRRRMVAIDYRDKGLEAVMKDIKPEDASASERGTATLAGTTGYSNDSPGGMAPAPRSPGLVAYPCTPANLANPESAFNPDILQPQSPAGGALSQVQSPGILAPRSPAVFEDPSGTRSALAVPPSPGMQGMGAQEEESSAGSPGTGPT